MKTTINPKALNMQVQGETMLLEANPEHSNTFIPKRLSLESITNSSKWNLENIITAK